MAVDPINSPEVTFESGANVSSIIDFTRITPRGLEIQIPSAWTAADILFQSSLDGVNFSTRYEPDTDDGAVPIRLTGIATGESRVYVLPATMWGAGVWNYMRLLSVAVDGTTAVNQNADRILRLVTVR